MAPTITVRAHAKINLELRVLGARPDGFHDLETVFQALELHDTLHCVRRDGPFSIACTAAGVPVDARNLVWRAAAAVWRHLGRPGDPDGVAIRLEKAIPVQAGLGGGSSDAAATLVAVSRLWEVSLTRGELTGLAAGLGSDVAFFLAGGTAIGRGRGERLVPLPDLPPHWTVLACPAFGVSTADAYGWYDADGPAPAATAPIDDRWTLAPGPIRNDLEGPVTRRHPELGLARAALLAGGAVAAGLCGSGSAVFGLFPARDTAERAESGLAGAGWRTLLTRTARRLAEPRGIV